MADCILVGGGGGGTLSGDVTASKADVLTGKRTVTTDSGDEVVEGTMPNRGAVSHSLALNGTYTVPAGYHNGSGKVTQALTVITPTTTNLALNGTYTIPQGWHSGTGKVTQNLTVIAAANHTLAINGTYTIPQGWHNGQGKVVQNVTTQGATNYYATTSAQTISSGRYLTGNLTIGALSHANLTAANIKKGVTININNGNKNVWSVTGTWEGYVPTSNQPFNRGAWGSGWSIVGQKPREGNYTQAVTISYPGSSIHLTPDPNTASAQGTRGGAYVYLKRITMNGINTVNISVSGNIGTISSNNYFVVLGIWNTLPSTQFQRSAATVYAQTSSTLTTTETTLSINVASITTDQYIAFGAFGMANNNSYLDITRIWFT